MPDPRFTGTVIYMCVHDANGAFGLVVNQRMETVPGTAVAERLGIAGEASDAPVALHWGGPVAPGRGFVLHGGDYASRSTVPVAGGVAFSVDEAAVSDLLSGAGPERPVFAFATPAGRRASWMASSPAATGFSPPPTRTSCSTATRRRCGRRRLTVWRWICRNG